MRVIDSVIEPKPEHQRWARSEPSTMRVYTSSLPGLLSITLTGPGGMAGLRIDREQAEMLANALDKFIALDECDDDPYR